MNENQLISYSFKMVLTASKVPLNVMSIGGLNKSCNVCILVGFFDESVVPFSAELAFFNSSSCCPY